MSEKSTRPTMDSQTEEFVKELYKAHFTPKEAASLVPFGYGCLIARWNKFQYAGIEKYDRFELIKQRGNLVNAQT